MEKKKRNSVFEFGLASLIVTAIALFSLGDTIYRIEEISRNGNLLIKTIWIAVYAIIAIVLSVISKCKFEKGLENKISSEIKTQIGVVCGRIAISIATIVLNVVLFTAFFGSLFSEFLQGSII